MIAGSICFLFANLPAFLLLVALVIAAMDRLLTGGGTNGSVNNRKGQQQYRPMQRSRCALPQAGLGESRKVACTNFGLLVDREVSRLLRNDT